MPVSSFLLTLSECDLVKARAFLFRILIQWSCSTKCRGDLRTPHTPHLCENTNACAAHISSGLASHTLELREGSKSADKRGEAQALPGLHGWYHLCLGRGEHNKVKEQWVLSQ